MEALWRAPEVSFRRRESLLCRILARAPQGLGWATALRGVPEKEREMKLRLHGARPQTIAT